MLLECGAARQTGERKLCLVKYASILFDLFSICSRKKTQHKPGYFKTACEGLILCFTPWTPWHLQSTWPEFGSPGLSSIPLPFPQHYSPACDFPSLEKTIGIHLSLNVIDCVVSPDSLSLSWEGQTVEKPEDVDWWKSFTLRNESGRRQAQLLWKESTLWYLSTPHTHELFCHSSVAIVLVENRTSEVKREAL